MGVRVWAGVASLAVVVSAGCSDQQEPRTPREVGAVVPAQVRSSTVAAAQSALPQLETTLAVLDAALETQASGPTASLEFQGPGPKPLPESRRAIDRSSPESLLEGALAALAAKDVAALARLSVDRPGLTQDDAAAAERRFLASAVQPYWKRVKAAVAAGSFTVHADGDRAYVDLEVGGAAGRYRIGLQRKDAGWYLAD